MSRLAGADAFFVYVDSVATPQLLGGLVVMDHDATDAVAYRDRLTAITQAHLPELPRFGQRIVVPTSRWHRPRWAPVAELDWCWHIPLRDLTDAQGNPAAHPRHIRLWPSFSAHRCRATDRPGASWWRPVLRRESSRRS